MGNSIIEIMCEYCGAKNPLDEQFCWNCGQSTRMKIVPYTERVEKSKKEFGDVQPILSKNKETFLKKQQESIGSIGKESIVPEELVQEEVRSEINVREDLHNEQYVLERKAEEDLRRKLLQNAQKNAMKQFSENYSNIDSTDLKNEPEPEDLLSMEYLIKRFEQSPQDGFYQSLSVNELKNNNLMPLSEEANSFSETLISGASSEKEKEAELSQFDYLSDSVNSNEITEEITERNLSILNYKNCEEREDLLQKLTKVKLQEFERKEIVFPSENIGFINDELLNRPFTPLKEWEKSSAVVEQESVSTSEPAISSTVGSADPSEGVEPEVFSGIVSEVSSVDESSVSSTAGQTDSSEAVERIQSSAMEPANPSEFLFVVPSDPLHFEEHISIEKDENENTRSNRNENLNSRDTEPEDQAIRDEYYDLLFEGEEKLSEEKIYGVDRRKVERFLGGNDDYYLFKFNRIERKKQVISLNGAGFLLGGIWLLYRKQYLIPMLMYLASIMSIVFFPPAILLMPLICRVIAGCFGNVMYYRYVRKQVEEARFSKKRSTDIDLPENGGRSFKLAAAYMLIGILFTGFVFVTAYYFRPEWIVLWNEQLQNFGLWQIPF